jgi:hypothetical protein
MPPPSDPAHRLTALIAPVGQRLLGRHARLMRASGQRLGETVASRHSPPAPAVAARRLTPVRLVSRSSEALPVSAPSWEPSATESTVMPGISDWGAEYLFGDSAAAVSSGDAWMGGANLEPRTPEERRVSRLKRGAPEVARETKILEADDTPPPPPRKRLARRPAEDPGSDTGPIPTTDDPTPPAPESPPPPPPTADAPPPPTADAPTAPTIARQPVRLTRAAAPPRATVQRATRPAPPVRPAEAAPPATAKPSLLRRMADRLRGESPTPSAQPEDSASMGAAPARIARIEAAAPTAAPLETPPFESKPAEAASMGAPAERAPVAIARVEREAEESAAPAEIAEPESAPADASTPGEISPAAETSPPAQLSLPAHDSPPAHDSSPAHDSPPAQVSRRAEGTAPVEIARVERAPAPVSPPTGISPPAPVATPAEVSPPAEIAHVSPPAQVPPAAQVSTPAGVSPPDEVSTPAEVSPPAEIAQVSPPAQIARVMRAPAAESAPVAVARAARPRVGLQRAAEPAPARPAGTDPQRLARALGTEVQVDEAGNQTVEMPLFSTAPRTVTRALAGEPESVESAIQESVPAASVTTPSAPATTTRPPAVDIDHITETVIENIRRELLVEREQAGGPMDLL